MTAAIALFVFGAVTALAALELPLGTLRAPESGFFPLLLGVLLALLSVAQGASVYRARQRLAPAAAAAPAWRLSEGPRRSLAFMGAVVVAVALLPLLGYALVCLILMPVLLYVLGVVRWPVIGAVSVATALACYFLFVRTLGIPLPSGVLGF